MRLDSLIQRKVCPALIPELCPTMHQPDFPTVPAFAKTQAAALAELIAIQHDTLRFGDSLTAQTPAALNARPAEKAWSALECLEHLDRYADHYLPLLEAKAVLAKTRTKGTYKPGLIGKRFALALHPALRKKTLRSPKRMNTLGAPLDAEAVVVAFRQNQQAYLRVLERLEGRDLHGNRIPVSAFPIVKLSLGDMLHTLVWHNARHVLQAGEAVG